MSRLLAAAQEVILSRAEEATDNIEYNQPDETLDDDAQTPDTTLSAGGSALAAAADDDDDDDFAAAAQQQHAIGSTSASLVAGDPGEPSLKSGDADAEAGGGGGGGGGGADGAEGDGDGGRGGSWAVSGKNNIMVCVRVRPMNRTERGASSEVVRVMDENVIVIIDPKTQDATRSFLDPLRAARTREKRCANVLLFMWWFAFRAMLRLHFIAFVICRDSMSRFVKIIMLAPALPLPPPAAAASRRYCTYIHAPSCPDDGDGRLWWWRRRR